MYPRSVSPKRSENKTSGGGGVDLKPHVKLKRVLFFFFFSSKVLFFPCVQCEVKLAQKRGRLESNLSSTAGDDEEGDDGGDSDSDDESSAKARYFSYVKRGLYYVTEMERFAPPRKRPRTVTKNYRLVSLRSTTPEELYQRKVGSHRCLHGLREAQIVSSFAKKKKTV